MDFVLTHIGEVVALISGGGGAWLVHLFRSRKQRSREEFTALNAALQVLQSNYHTLIEQNGELMDKLVHLQDRYDGIMNENIGLKGEVHQLTKEVERLRRELAKFNKKNENER
jgi:dynactin complex subunit